MFVQGLFGCAMSGLITVERDFKRQSALTPESKPEEGFGRGDVPLGAQQEVDGSSLFVDGTVEIGPASFDFDVGLVDAPGPSSWPSEAVPAFLEFGRIVLNPTHDRRVRQGESTFGHHLHEITKAEFVAQILAHAEDDYFAIEMAAFEEFVHVEHSSAPSFEQSAGKLCRVNPVRTRAPCAASSGRASAAAENPFITARTSAGRRCVCSTSSFSERGHLVPCSVTSSFNTRGAISRIAGCSTDCSM